MDSGQLTVTATRPLHCTLRKALTFLNGRGLRGRCKKQMNQLPAGWLQKRGAFRPPLM